MLPVWSLFFGTESAYGPDHHRPWPQWALSTGHSLVPCWVDTLFGLESLEGLTFLMFEERSGLFIPSFSDFPRVHVTFHPMGHHLLERTDRLLPS